MPGFKAATKSGSAQVGLTPEAVHELNPRAILCTAQAFSSTSAERDAPAYDDIVQAASGMCDTYRRVYGEPRYSPSIIVDKVCGMTIVNTLLGALVHRNRTGEGQWVDVPMVDTMVAFNLVEHLSGHTFSPPEGPVGWGRTLVASRRPHAAKDGWVCVMPYSDRDWQNFFRELDLDELREDPRFTTQSGRHRNPGPLQEALAEIIATRTVAEWLELSSRLGIAAHEVLDLDRIEDSPYLRARRTLIELEHPSEGTWFAVRFPADFSLTPVERYAPAPHLGRDEGASWAERPMAPPGASPATESGSRDSR